MQHGFNLQFPASFHAAGVRDVKDRRLITHIRLALPHFCESRWTVAFAVWTTPHAGYKFNGLGSMLFAACVLGNYVHTNKRPQ